MKLKAIAMAALCTVALAAHADDAADQTTQINNAVQKALADNGIQFANGYMRAGFYDATKGSPEGQISLGGDLQKFRLGNEGDNYFEVLLGKYMTVDGGVKAGFHFMPSDYNGSYQTKQVYADVTGLSFAPEASFWAGQRYHRIEDIHILDHFLMQDGDNYGAGIDGIAVGQGKLNLSVSSSGSTGNSNSMPNNAHRANFQLLDVPLNPGGSITVTGAVVTGDFGIGSGGNSFGLLHHQKNLFTEGLNNSLFLQTSTGHASLEGEFYALDVAGVPQAGAKQSRVADSINWQVGKFGGQAFVASQSVSPDNAAHYRDDSFGGRISYGIAQNVKLLAEVGIISRAIDGQATQTLNKATLALALSPDTNFWTRPEVRFYVSNFDWNAAALAANSSLSTSNALNSKAIGVQVEYWF